MRVLFDLTVQLYEILLRVDRRVAVMRHMDSVCDLLYHIKYQFTGDSVKQDAERVVRQLKPALQLRLRFIAQVWSYKFYKLLYVVIVQSTRYRSSQRKPIL